MPRPLAAPIAPVVADSEVLAAVLREVLALRAEVAEIRADQTRRQRVCNDAAVVDLLRAIVATAGAVAFSSAELAEHAALPTAATLRAAIVAAVGTVNPRRLGKMLRAIEGRDIGGLQIIREGEDREGVIWRVAEVTSALPLRAR